MPATAHQDTERDLLRRSRLGEKEAFGMIVQTHQHRIFSFVVRMVRDPALAEDLTQDAFIRAYRKLHLYDPERPFLPWLFRIAANLTRNHLKSAASRELPHSPEHFTQVPTLAAAQDEQTAQRAAVQQLERAIFELSAKDRAPLVLKHIEGLSYGEISQILGISVVALKMRVSRARRKLRKLLEAGPSNSLADGNES